jgi:hypothetical protein
MYQIRRGADIPLFLIGFVFRIGLLFTGMEHCVPCEHLLFRRAGFATPPPVVLHLDSSLGEGLRAELQGANTLGHVSAENRAPDRMLLIWEHTSSWPVFKPPFS